MYLGLCSNRPSYNDTGDGIGAQSVPTSSYFIIMIKKVNIQLLMQQLIHVREYVIKIVI